MRKGFIALAIAAALTAPMITQADSNLLMAQPALFFQFEVDQAQPVTMIAEVPAVIDTRTVPQLEAAVILASTPSMRSNDDMPGNYDSIANQGDGPLEVGWRSS